MPLHSTTAGSAQQFCNFSRATVVRRRVAAHRLVCNAKGERESTESLFMKELKRRGIDSTSQADSAGADPASKVRTAPKFAEDAPPAGNNPDQLSVSRQLNSEGLEGLIPRATQLVRLGGGFFLAFLPFMLVISVVFSAIYLGFGEQFIHSGNSASAPPPHLDPYELLNEPTVDPMIPLR